ncbi:MAG: hypothetical protein HOE90_15000 [Bacteriovoracaceae bacterium]|jgi:hypothetical protein|nr:hypothetical protein [Bacteriovoracaceae bacterium]
MRAKTFLKLSKKLLPLITLAIFFSACMPQGGSSRKSKITDAASDVTGGGSDADGQGTSREDDDTETVTLTQKTEIRHIADPVDGVFKTKVSIPKNFSGFLYISGINVTALNDKRVKVRFKFGKDYEAITLDATVARAMSGGITPQTDIQVLVLDFDGKPFKDLRLLYDLYDYSTYAASDSPTSDNRDTNLYCRGVNLTDDPTFEATSSSTTCSSSGDKCLYAYAKVVDKGLVDDSSGSDISTLPSSHQVDLDGNGSGASSTYDTDTSANKIKKCLPDNAIASFASISSTLTTFAETATASPYDYSFSSASVAISYGDYALTNSSVDYKFKGSYRALNTSSWQISSDAVVHDPAFGTQPYGIYRAVQTAADFNTGYGSYMFPLAGKLELETGVQYIGGTTWYSTKSVQTMLSSGESEWMDGCNIRIKETNPETSEHVGSCNVSATIEVYYTDDDGDEVIVDESIDVKLQIVRESDTNSVGEDVLFSNYSTCEGSNGCSADECCFNSRCWSRDVVYQCLNDTDDGSKGVGDSCSSDYECSSLCCNRSMGKCAVHDTSSDDPTYCSKTAGDSCVAKEWCAVQNVNQCYIVKTGLDNQGQTTCALRCYNVPTHGDCRNGTCVPPTQPTAPTFDPNNPDCSTAIDAPVSL